LQAATIPATVRYHRLDSGVPMNSNFPTGFSADHSRIDAMIKPLLKRYSPGLFHWLASIRFFLKCKRALGPCQDLVVRKVFKNGPIHVKGGPFDGMAYYNKTIWGTITAKWLGCYELEVQPVIDEIVKRGYPVIVDIGAAEGYYAVGLALKMPGSRVVSYDTDPIARFRQKQLAGLNSVSNLEIRKYCSVAELESFRGTGAVVICDIEGFEFELMDPATAPVLKTLDLLVETHRTGTLEVAAMADAIEGRFAATHEIVRHVATKRDRVSVRDRLPELKILSDNELDFALDEGRYPGQFWLWMKAKRD
jgi:hypothetical protein